jgi:uncharacterized protein CbrC (UPF0167 family)
MVSGIGGSLANALRSATTGISRWLEEEYKLNPGEVAMVLGSSMRYEIAEVVDPQVHVVAKLQKIRWPKFPNRNRADLRPTAPQKKVCEQFLMAVAHRQPNCRS